MPSPRDPDSRRRLARILGLPESAAGDEFRRAAGQLLDVLRLRRSAPHESPSADTLDGARGEADGGDADRALAAEIGELASSVERWVEGGSEAPGGVSQVDRRRLASALIGAGVIFAVLIAYASGVRIVWQQSDEFKPPLEHPATLMLVGRMPGATLRVLDADREELFVKTPAQGAIVELAPGRYALDVSREDCPDRWTRSVYFEAGATHRFEPILCVGEGRVTIRSTVNGDRLMIDGFDVGGTSAQPHTLSVGDHEIRIEKPGYAPYQSRIRIQPDSDLQLRAEMITYKQQRQGRHRDSPLPIETPPLTSSAQLKPEPFDLGDLMQEIAPRKTRHARTSLLQRKGAGGLPDGGSTAWHDRIFREIITRFDTDGSGRIDQLAESESISCALWREIEEDFERGGLGLSMARYYGFDGTEWHVNALGFSRNMRSAAYEKMKECGLQP